METAGLNLSKLKTNHIIAFLSLIFIAVSLLLIVTGQGLAPAEDFYVTKIISAEDSGPIFGEQTSDVTLKTYFFKLLLKIYPINSEPILVLKLFGMLLGLGAILIVFFATKLIFPDDKLLTVIVPIFLLLSLRFYTYWLTIGGENLAAFVFLLLFFQLIRLLTSEKNAVRNFAVSALLIVIIMQIKSEFLLITAGALILALILKLFIVYHDEIRSSLKKIGPAGYALVSLLFIALIYFLSRLPVSARYLIFYASALIKPLANVAEWPKLLFVMAELVEKKGTLLSANVILKISTFLYLGLFILALTGLLLLAQKIIGERIEFNRTPEKSENTEEQSSSLTFGWRRNLENTQIKSEQLAVLTVVFFIFLALANLENIFIYPTIYFEKYLLFLSAPLALFWGLGMRRLLDRRIFQIIIGLMSLSLFLANIISVWIVG